MKKEGYVKLTKKERETILKSMRAMIDRGVPRADVISQFSHIASQRTLYRLYNDSQDDLKVLHPTISPTTHKFLKTKIEETGKTLAQILSNKDRSKTSQTIIEFFKEDINREIPLAGEFVGNVQILPTDEMMLRRGRRDAMNDLIKLLHLDDLIFKAMLETSPPPTNTDFETIRKKLKV